MSNAYSQYVVDPVTNQWVKVLGSISYNDLRDTPIKNVVGSTAETFINLAGLDVGHYALTGFFKIDSLHEVGQTSATLDVVVRYDEITSKKVILFPSVLNGDYYINKLIYDNYTVESIDKLPVGGIDWGEFG